MTGDSRDPVEDLTDVSQSMMDASAQSVVDRAISYARQWHHGLLTNEHIFLAFAERRMAAVCAVDA
jgi:hypothetical protein